MNEKKLALQKSRAGHIGNLTKIHNEITRLMESDASSEDVVLRERMKFDEATTNSGNESTTWTSTSSYGKGPENPNEKIIVFFLAKREGADVVGFPDRVRGCQR